MDVDTSSGFMVGTPRPLFHRTFAGNTWVFGGNDYAASPNGQRFLVMAPLDDPGADEIRVLLGR